ncbi:Acidic nuclear phosphoprotein 32 family member E, partial [Podarcis lilfordi]
RGLFFNQGTTVVLVLVLKCIKSRESRSANLNKMLRGGSFLYIYSVLLPSLKAQLFSLNHLHANSDRLVFRRLDDGGSKCLSSTHKAGRGQKEKKWSLDAEILNLNKFTTLVIIFPSGMNNYSKNQDVFYAFLLQVNLFLYRYAEPAQPPDSLDNPD